MKGKSLIIKSIIIILSIILLVQLYLDKKINLASGIYTRKFEQNVVFYPQHQDDEVLWGASAILRAIETCGKDHVYIVLVADGLGVNVFNDKAYENMTNKQKKEIRDTEFKEALNQLGIKKKNIIILSDIKKKDETNFELMEKTILKFESTLKHVTHVSHHYKYDDHPMHRKNGQILKSLKDKGQIKSSFYYIKPKYVTFISPSNRIIYEVNNVCEYNKVKKACYEYKKVDIKNGRYGVGYISSHSYFDNLLKSPNFKSILSNK